MLTTGVSRDLFRVPLFKFCNQFVNLLYALYEDHWREMNVPVLLCKDSLSNSGNLLLCFYKHSRHLLLISNVYNFTMFLKNEFSSSDVCFFSPLKKPINCGAIDNGGIVSM